MFKCQLLPTKGRNWLYEIKKTHYVESAMMNEQQNRLDCI